MVNMIHRLPNRFLQEDGNITIFSIFNLMLILVITGAAVDIMRLEATRAKMQSTMDRAVLAAADLDQQQAPSAVIDDYLAKAGMGDLLVNKTINAGANFREVEVDGDALLDTIFLNMSGFDTMTSPARSKAEEKIANVEISMVLDISGSMRWNGRIDKLKPAAQNFVSKVMTDQTRGVTTLNLIPFAGHVNPGDVLFDYFRGERPKLKQNNGWGNGDQDAPGNSLCNNNAENADEGAADPSCTDGTATVSTEEGLFTEWSQAIKDVVIYFDVDGDDLFDRAHKIANFPDTAPRDADAFYKGMVAFVMAQDSKVTSPDQFLGMSIRSGGRLKKYFQVKGDENGPASDPGPTKHKGRLPGNTYDYAHVDYVAWESSYVAPVQPEPEQNVNMPSSCIEIYAAEFASTAMPTSSDFVPHFHHWQTDEATMDWGWCPEEDSAIQYYSSDAASLNSFIGNLRLHDGTGIQYGLKYALSLLDPVNRTALAHLIDNGLVAERFRGRPVSWNDPETEKFIVVMTDGQTTQQVRPVDPKAAVNSEVELSQQPAGAHYEWSSRSTNISQLQQQCELAKSLGVTIFAISLETNASATQDMKNCASSEAHHFHVQGDALYETFDIIARQINNLRLVQ